MPYPQSQESGNLMQTYLYHGPGITIWANMDLITWGDARTYPWYTGAGELTAVSNASTMSGREEDEWSCGSSCGTWDLEVADLEAGQYLPFDPIAEARDLSYLPWNPIAEALDLSSDC